MDNLPLISVIVPVYNVEKYLDCCVASIAGQTYRNLEILLVDDGSTDGSGTICDAWATKDSRVKVIHQPNGGGGQARNTALAQAQGELIGFVDSDDYIAQEMYERLYGLMESQQADIAECAYRISTEKETLPSEPEGDWEKCYTAEEAMRAHIREEAFQQVIWNKLYRWQVAGRVRFPTGKLIDDEFWTYRVLGNAQRLAACGSVLYTYRQSPGSAMRRPYSARRLQGLDAKRERLAYVRRQFPALEDEAKYDLMMSCLFYMQSVQRHLKGEERRAAEEKILSVAGELKPVKPSPTATGKRRTLLLAAELSLRGTGRLLNLLTDVGILT